MNTFMFCLFAISGLIFPSFAHADAIYNSGLDKLFRAQNEFNAKKCQPEEEELACGRKDTTSWQDQGRIGISVKKNIPFVEKCPSLEDLRYYELKRIPVTVTATVDILRGTYDKTRNEVVGYEIYLCKRTPEGMIRAQKDAKEAEKKRVAQKLREWAGILTAIGLGGYLVLRLRRRSTVPPPTGSNG